jgi:hypothetical protein
MHDIFISYHHKNDQAYKDELLRQNDLYEIFRDGSVDTGDISDGLTDQAIREKIRDEYLRDTTVTILLVGSETWGRKHPDWELYSSMFDGIRNKRSGILVINLPSAVSSHSTAPHGEHEKTNVHPEHSSWMSIDERTEYEERYPLMPNRIVDNLLESKALVSVVPWEKINHDPDKLRLLIELAHNDRTKCEYDLSRPMRRNNASED